jgi:hypothetical protein
VGEQRRQEGALGTKIPKTKLRGLAFANEWRQGSFLCRWMWLMWDKAGLSGWVATIDQHRREGALGTEIPKTESCRLGFHQRMAEGVVFA